MKLTTAVVLFGSVLGLTACGVDGRDGSGDGDDGSGSDGSGSGSDIPNPTAKRCNKMDLVFVVDDSGSMAEEQNNLGQNFPMFADVLANYVDAQGNQLDYRIAVTTTGKTVTQTVTLPGSPLPPIVTTEMGDDGAFRNNCNVARNYLDPSDANLASALGCRANVGTNGPGVEMPLITTQMALKERIADGSNAGFIREDALLGIVILTDEDDSSTTLTNITVSIANPNPTPDYNPSDLVTYLDGFKGNRTRWSAGVIAGETACTSSFGDAVAATRLKDFVTMANSGGTTQAVFSSICDGNLSTALTQVIDQFQNACETIIL